MAILLNDLSPTGFTCDSDGKITPLIPDFPTHGYDIIDNNGDEFYTVRHVADDGTITDIKVPKCIRYIGGTSPITTSIECKTQVYDIRDNDLDCTRIVVNTDGTTNTTTFPGEYVLKTIRIYIVNPINNTEALVANNDNYYNITLNNNGQILFIPEDCGQHLRIEVDSCLKCGDTVTNLVTDTFFSPASPKGSLRLKKEIFKLVDSQIIPAENIQTGDKLIMSFKICTNGAAPNVDGSPLGPVATPILTDTLDDCYANPTFYDAVATESGVTIGINNTNIIGNVITLGGLPPGANTLPTLNVGECFTFRIVVDVICPQGFGSILNYAYVEGDGDGDGFNGDTYASDFAIVSEIEIPEARISWDNEGIPDWQTGLINGAFNWTKEPSGSSITTCEATELLIDVLNCDGTLFGTYGIDGSLCSNINTWLGNGKGTLSSFDILPFLSGDPLIGITFDKQSWANSLGFVHQDLTLPLNTDCLCNNHSGKSLNFNVFVGGVNSIVSDPGCILQSTNVDNFDEVLFIYQQQYTGFHASQNGGNRFEVYTHHVNDFGQGDTTVTPLGPLGTLSLISDSIGSTGCMSYRRNYELDDEINGHPKFEVKNETTWSNGLTSSQNGFITEWLDFGVWLRCNNNDKCNPNVGFNMTVENQQGNGGNNDYGDVNRFQLIFNGNTYNLTLPNAGSSGITTRGQMVDMTGESCGFYPIVLEAENDNNVSTLNAILYRNIKY